MMNNLKVVICAIILTGGTIVFAADNKEYKYVQVTVYSQFRGIPEQPISVQGEIPAPTSYGPNVPINPIDRGSSQHFDSIVVSNYKKVKVWDAMLNPSVPTVFAQCGPIPSDADKITITIDGQYDPRGGGKIWCYITKD